LTNRKCNCNISVNNNSSRQDCNIHFMDVENFRKVLPVLLKRTIKNDSYLISSHVQNDDGLEITRLAQDGKIIIGQTRMPLEFFLP